MDIIMDNEYLGYINALTTMIVINDLIINKNYQKHIPVIKLRYFNNTKKLEVLEDNQKIENFNKLIQKSKNNLKFINNRKNFRIYNKNYNRRENYNTSR